MAGRLPMYEIEIRHTGLNKYRHLRGSDPYVVRQKAEAQQQAWDEMWAKKQTVNDRLEQRERQAQARDQMKQLAEEQTQEAQEELARLRATLAHTLTVNDAVDWNSLKDHKPFEKKPPVLKKIPAPTLASIPLAPLESDPTYAPKLGLWGYIFPSIRQRRVQEARDRFASDLAAWQESKTQVESANTRALTEQEQMVKQTEWKHFQLSKQYDEEKQAFLAQQLANNDVIDAKKKDYLTGEQGAVLDYCEMVLSKSQYPDYFPQEFDLEYQPEGKILLVEYAMPARDSLPTLKDVKFVQSKGELKQSHLSDKELDALYDEVLYQITLRSLHELFEADVAQAIDAVVLNGRVTAVDKSTGQTVTTCVLSIQASKQEFLAVNLEHIDPKACFKKFKGVGSSKLHSMTAVPPILSLDRNDGRFVAGRDVAHALDNSTNLATMEWEEFEHLIREIFAKEFSSGGGEVKVTRASRDGGVDAVAFDPDPIRGGKIVIQAKRYANTVGVSAVRDLYGTVMNEGATKGILVTTANFGPDAYEFAKAKPLTLLNGSNLLHLLEKHGHRAKIDLQAAKGAGRGSMPS